MPRHPLSALRLQLTAWYVATFGVILGLLGGGLFLIIRLQLSRQLDDSMRQATKELVGAAHIREMEAARATGPVVDAIDELRIPERTLYLFDLDGHPVRPATAESWIADAARQAALG